MQLLTTYETIRKDGEEIHKLISESRVVFEAEQDSGAWVNYLKYLDDLVVQGLQAAVRSSLQYLQDNMDQSYLARNELQALHACDGRGSRSRLYGHDQEHLE